MAIYGRLEVKGHILVEQFPIVLALHLSAVWAEQCAAHCVLPKAMTEQNAVWRDKGVICLLYSYSVRWLKESDRCRCREMQIPPTTLISALALSKHILKVCVYSVLAPLLLSIGFL